MPAPLNRFKAALAKGDKLYGCWAAFADAYATEVLATAGFDWLVIDGEHAPNDLPSIMRQLQVVQGYDSHPIVRLPMGEAWLIKQVLDAGAQTLLIPDGRKRRRSVRTGPGHALPARRHSRVGGGTGACLAVFGAERLHPDRQRSDVPDRAGRNLGGDHGAG